MARERTAVFSGVRGIVLFCFATGETDILREQKSRRSRNLYCAQYIVVLLIFLLVTWAHFVLS